MRTFNGFVLPFGCAFVWTMAAHAQFRGGQEWTTAGGDAQRSSWVRSDPKISVERIAKPGFATRLEDQAERGAECGIHAE